jgi:hypothetical protein
MPIDSVQQLEKCGSIKDIPTFIVEEQLGIFEETYP